MITRKVPRNGLLHMFYFLTVIFIIYFMCTMTFITMMEVQGTADFNDNANPVFIRLNKDVFDPLQDNPELSGDLKISVSQGYHIIQFMGPIHQDQRFDLEDCGAVILEYIPDYAFLVKMNHTIESRIRSIPEVRWVGLYHPGYKIHDELNYKTGEIELNVLVFSGSSDTLIRVRNNLQQMGGKITYSGDDNHIIRTIIDASKIRDVAFIPEVQWLDLFEPPSVKMNNIRSYTGVNINHLNGFDGTGIVGEVKDNGIDLSHPDFVGQVIATEGSIIPGAHGTSSFGIVFSTGANNNDALGILPGASGVFCQYSESRYTSIGNLSNDWGGVFQSNSWGSGLEDAEYDSYSYENDLSVFDYDVTMLYSAGNSQGVPVGPKTVTPDSAAKNVIGVGAVNHYDNTDWSDDRWVNAGSWMTPSQGPADDGRIKPDICGPFDQIYTTDSTVYTFDTFKDGYNDTSDYYDDYGGTSGAAPVTAGRVGEAWIFKTCIPLLPNILLWMNHNPLQQVRRSNIQFPQRGPAH
jgi:hypothetical protein